MSTISIRSINYQSNQFTLIKYSQKNIIPINAARIMQVQPIAYNNIAWSIIHITHS